MGSDVVMMRIAACAAPGEAAWNSRLHPASRMQSARPRASHAFRTAYGMCIPECAVPADSPRRRQHML